MSEIEKNQFIYEIAEDLIKKFNIEISNDILNIINKHLYNYDINKKPTAVTIFDDKTERVLKMFLGTKKLEGKSEGTLKQYYREIRLLLSFLGCSIDDVTTGGIKLYLMTMKTEKNLENSTVENMRSYLSAVFTWAANESFIKVNPCLSINPIKMEIKIRESFSKDELEKIKEVCKKDLKRKALISFLYSTGCRVSEVCSVNKSDIDFINQTLIVLGKGNKERRVYLSSECCEKIQEYLRSRKDNCEALFINNKGNRIAPGGVRWILKDIESKTNISNVHPHRFRRTLATNLLNAGMPIQDVAKLLGHARVETTQKYYFHEDKKVELEYRKIINS